MRGTSAGAPPLLTGRGMKVVLYFRIKEVRWTVGDEDLQARSVVSRR